MSTLFDRSIRKRAKRKQNRFLGSADAETTERTGTIEATAATPNLLRKLDK